MLNCIEMKNSTAVFGKDEFLYKEIIDDFQNARFIGVLTFNISTKCESVLLEAVKKACHNGTSAIVITNIPKRFGRYFDKKYAFAAKPLIDNYIKLLNPKEYDMRLKPYFSFDNHAKIIMTENVIYFGSSNFSDESRNNFECGVISKDKKLIKEVIDKYFFNSSISAVPYYKYDFVVAITNLKQLSSICRKAKEKLFDASFEPYSDYETRFQEKWVFRTDSNDLTLNFVETFTSIFSRFDEALEVVKRIVDQYAEEDELPESVEELENLYDNYQQTFESFDDTISCLFEELKPLASFDVNNEALKKLSDDYGMEAYEENLNSYVEKVIIEANEKYQSLVEDAEESVRDTLEHLDRMIEYFNQMEERLLQLLEINPKIDNTGIN